MKKFTLDEVIVSKSLSMLREMMVIFMIFECYMSLQYVFIARGVRVLPKESEPRAAVSITELLAKHTD